VCAGEGGVAVSGKAVRGVAENRVESSVCILINKQTRKRFVFRLDSLLPSALPPLRGPLGGPFSPQGPLRGGDKAFCVHKKRLERPYNVVEAAHYVVIFARASNNNASRLENEEYNGRIVWAKDQAGKYTRLVCAAGAVLRVQLLYVDCLQVRDSDVAHYILYNMVFEGHVEIRKHVFQHVDSAANSRHGNLLARRARDHQLARGKEQGRGFGLIDADRNGSKSFLVIATIGNAARNHFKVDFVSVGLDMDGRNHVVCSRHRFERQDLSVELLTYWFPVKDSQQLLHALGVTGCLILEQRVRVCRGLALTFVRNVAILPLPHSCPA